jgi:nitroreductase
MPEDNSNLFEIMATTRSMRRLKPDLVPAPLIRKILKAGVSAPSGGNMQRWRFLVIRDPKVKQTVRRVPLADVVYEDRWGQPYRDQGSPP